MGKLKDSFSDDMNWDNYGSYWQIDHTIPSSLYDLRNKEEIKKCWNKRNLRPLEKSENITKGDKLIEELIVYYEIDDLLPKNILKGNKHGI